MLIIYQVINRMCSVYFFFLHKCVLTNIYFMLLTGDTNSCKSENASQKKTNVYKVCLLRHKIYVNNGPNMHE